MLLLTDIFNVLTSIAVVYINLYSFSEVQSDTIVPYQPAQIIRSPVTQANQTASTIKTPVTTSAPVTAPETTQAGSSNSCSIVRVTPSENLNKPKRAGSLGLFFRKVSFIV